MISRSWYQIRRDGAPGQHIELLAALWQISNILQRQLYKSCLCTSQYNLISGMRGYRSCTDVCVRKVRSWVMQAVVVQRVSLIVNRQHLCKKSLHSVMITRKLSSQLWYCCDHRSF